MLRKKIVLTNASWLLEEMEGSIFRRESFALLVAGDGEEAFRLVEEEDPVLVILDLEMAGLSGDACCLRVKEDPFLNQTPVILVTPEAGDEPRTRCREAHCDAVLERPVKEGQLVETACRLLHINTRAEDRLRTEIPMRFGVAGGKLHAGRALDLNSGGLFLETARLSPVDTLLLLEINLPGRGKPLSAKARVAWVNHPEWLKAGYLPPGMGLQFLDLGEQGEEALGAFLSGKGAPDSCPSQPRAMQAPA